MILLYVVSFLIIVILVNNNPDQYAYAIYAVISGFTSYIPGLNAGLVPILTVVAGTIAFILSLIGAIGMGYRAKPNEAFLAFLFLISYWFFTTTFILDILVPHRTLFFLVPLSLMVAAGILELPSSLEKLRIIIGRPFGRYSGLAIAFIKTNRHKITAVIIIGFLVVGIVARANFEPIVRSNPDANHFLQFGQIASPIVTTELVEKVQEVVTPGEAILCNPDTLTALYTFVEIDPASSPYWNILLNSNANFSNVFYSMNYFPGHSPSKWLIEHNGTLLILGMMDVKEGSMQYGFWKFNTLKFDSDPKLDKIYENRWGELIYKLNVTA
jgi:hypothetical protein